MAVLLPIIALAAGLFTAWIIGANSASPSFGPVTSAGAVGVLKGSLIVGVAAFLGATLQGGAVTDTIGNKLVSGVSFDIVTGTIILVTASTLILASILLQFPMPTAFTLLGSAIGAGMAAGGTPNVGQLQFIGFFWLIIPVVGVMIAYIAAMAMRSFVAKTDRNVKLLKYAVVVLGAYTAFTAGANQSGLVVGPLINAFTFDPVYLLVFAGFGMLIGAWMGSPRIIESVSREYSQMGPRRAVAALLSASLMAQFATLYGVPVSFNEAIIAAVIGSGLASGSGGVSKSKITWTIVAWIGALIASTVIAYAVTSGALALWPEVS